MIGQTPTNASSSAESEIPENAGVTPAADTAPASGTTEIGGRDGLDPTRYGDWEKNGRCIDF